MRASLLRFTLASALLTVLITTGIGASRVEAQTPITYIYDELGRLTGVVNTNGESAIYKYDAVGNLLSISRQSAGTVSIIEFTPDGGPVGTQVTISGTGFGTVPSQNVVRFNGVQATVAASTSTQITASVPGGATTGPISVTSPLGSATSSTSFTVSSANAPAITNFVPTIGVAGQPVTITGQNFQLLPANNRTTFNISFALNDSTQATKIYTSVPAFTGSGRISVATPYGKATGTGDFFVPPPGFTVAEVEFTARTTFGQSLAVNLPTAHKIALVVFDGTIGQRVSLLLKKGTIGVAEVSILKPDNTSLTSSSAGDGADALIEPVTLPVTGSYTIFIDPLFNYKGSLEMTLYDVPPDVQGTIVAGGDSVGVSLTVAGQNARLTFGGIAGQRVSVLMTDVTVPVSGVSLLHPNGANLGSVTVDDISDGFIDVVTLPVNGTYTIEIDPLTAYTGSMNVRLYQVPADIAGSIVIGGASVMISVGTPGQNANLTFSGTAGQRLKLRMTNVTISLSAVSILKPPNGAVFVGPVAVSELGETINTPTLPTIGTYTIVVDPTNESKGNMTLRLTLLP